MTTFVFDPRW